MITPVRDITILSCESGICVKDFPSLGVRASPDCHSTSDPRIFAGGDVVHGAMEVVNAVQAGKLAAFKITEFLSNGEN